MAENTPVSRYHYIRLEKEGGEIPEGWEPVGKAVLIGNTYWSILCEWVGEGDPNGEITSR